MNKYNYFDYYSDTNEYLQFARYPDEKRQNINLSRHSYAVMKSDMSKFGIEKDSEFINRVLENYFPLSSATISNAISKRKSELEKLLGTDDTAKHSINLICNELVRIIIKEVCKYPKGIQLKISINSINTFYLTGEGKKGRDYKISPCQEAIYYGVYGKGIYLKAVLEEFFHMPESEREKVFFLDRFNIINKAIKEKRQLEIMTAGHVFQVEPFEVIADSDQRYTYLAGISRFKGEDITKACVYPFRISRIDRLYITNSNFNLSKEQRRYIAEEIAKKGIAYLGNDIENIVIKLSEAGQKMYDQIISQRPVAINIDKESGIYKFNCSQLQIIHYFLKFGADAVILEPEELKYKFQEHYKNALNIYIK